MTEVTVLDTGCDDLAGKIAHGLQEYGAGTGDILIRSIRSLEEMAGKKSDILVLPDDAAQAGSAPGAVPGAKIRCAFLLLPGGMAGSDDSADLFDAGCVVTYGMSPKNTITLSSISEDTCVLALQRELVTTGGDVLERQEIKVDGGMRPDCLLAVAGTLLILGQKLSDTNP